MSLRRMAIFIGINILVSASVTLLVLSVWDAGRSPAHPIPTLAPTVIAAAPTTSVIAPTATPASIPPTAAPASRIYFVQSGDTLSAIARNFDIPIADLLAANNLKDGDLLSIGQKLIIPTGNSPTPLAVTPSPTPIKPRPVSTQSIALGDAFVTIREIVSNGRLSEEAVVLTNLGSKVNLKGWTLADGESHKYTFPDLTLLPNSEVNVHTKSGVNTATDLYWGQPEARWGATGAVAYLRDPNGKLIATYRVP
jgi:LysM repeat protein